MNLSVCITNLSAYVGGSLIYKRMELPVPADEFEDKFAAVLKRIGINEFCEEIFLSDWETDVPGLHDVIGEYTNVASLNELALIIDDLSEYDEEKLGAVLECECCRSLDDAKEIIENLDDFDLLSDVGDYEALGRYYVEELGAMEIPEHLMNYIDFEALGRDIYYSGSYHFVDGDFCVCDYR